MAQTSFSIPFDNTYKIYGLASPSDNIIRYIGYTKRPLHKRLKGHLTEKGITKKINWIKFLLKKGQKPIIVLLESDVFRDEVCSKEINYIKLFKSCGAKLVNGTGGGDGNVNITPETRLKISASGIGRVPWNKGKPYPMSEETKRKIALSNIGKHSKKGFKVSEETKNKLRQFHKGKIFRKRPMTPEEIEKMKLQKSIPVLQFDLNGNFIKEWKSQIDVRRELNLFINNACKGRRKTTGGFIWKNKT